jgi:aspartokinase/homoserine dehydrogenase 1
MKSKKGVSGKLFSTLGNNNINIRAIAQGASERNISIIIDEKDNIKALNSLHEAFFENNCKNVHLFITGVGNVGSNLIKQIFDQKKSLEENLRLKLKVMGLSNSKKMILSDTEIDLNNWKSKLDSSDISSNNDQFLNFSINQNLRNSIFIDNTANTDVTINYNNYLKNGIGIVTCNKIACSDNLEKYLELKSLSRNHNSPFLYETNVGAALPIINTLNNLINSGDRITKIEAILSGTLNFIFNNFNKENSFYEVVKKAVDLGYTEPDPKIDLCGIDVSRKILILARESGEKMEFSDVQNKIFLPKESLESNSKEEFLKSLKDNNDHFDQILNKAIEKRSRLKYVACLENGEASVGIKTVKEDHPFYNIEGRDNITVFHTDRYKDSPLVVKGPGAGGEFTASGVFADIIKASEK